MMDRLPRKRLFTSERSDPKALAGSVLHVPDIRRYLRLVHSRGGWGGDVYDEQNTPDFRFEGRSLSVYAGKVLGMPLGSIYMPLAYNGVVAKELADSGHSMLASDLSPHWVSHLEGIGLKALVRSFEDIPEGKFDAVVCFESYPVSCNLVGYLGMMRILSRGIPFIEIDSHPHLGTPPQGSRPIGSMEPAEARMRMSRRSRTAVRSYPLTGEEMARMAYDYGAAYAKHHAYHDDKNWFDFESLTATPASVRRMSLDLLLLETQDEWAWGEASISGLSRLFTESPEAIAASLSRLKEISSRYHIDEGMLLYSGIRNNAAGHDPEAIRKMTITE
jgi:hypothetical protein